MLRRCSWLSIGILIATAPTLAACGSTSKKHAAGGKHPNALSLSITEAGKTAKYTAPTSVAGGLVNLQLTNNGKAPHGAQLIRVDAPHTVPQAFQALGGNSNQTPPWIHFAGGVGRVPPGPSASAVVNLPPGQYIVADLGRGNGQPATAQLTVTAGQTGNLPATPATVTATIPSKDHYKWQINGQLKAGTQLITFDSKGFKAQHLIAGARLTGNPTDAVIIKALTAARGGPPPPFVDPSSLFGTSSLDGGNAEVTPLVLSKPGTYVLFCPLTDRDGGKPHFQEGLLTRVTIK